MKRLFALALLAASFITTSAQAALISTSWTDSADLGPTGQQYIADGGEYSYVHNILDNGYRPTIDRLDSFSLLIRLVDDDNNFWSDWLELAAVDLTSDGDDDYLISNFSGSGHVYGGSWFVEGLAQLRSDGILSVTVRSVYGDFNLIGSTLTATGKHNTSVPEPGALGLLGVGLLGIALGARRRKQAV